MELRTKQKSGTTSTAAQEAGGGTLPPPAPCAVQHTRRRGPPANVDMSTIIDGALLETASLALYANVALGDVAHSEDMASFVECALTATNIQLKSLLEGEKVATIPSTFREAMSLPEAAEWKAATTKELNSLKDLGVHTLVPKSTIPPGKKHIGSRWVFKRKADGTFKARIVAQGWNVVPGVDCGRTSSPVCRLQSIWAVLAIAAEKNWEVLQLDAQTAFSARISKGRRASQSPQVLRPRAGLRS